MYGPFDQGYLMIAAGNAASSLRQGYWSRAFAESVIAKVIAEWQTGKSWGIVTTCNQMSASETGADFQTWALSLKRAMYDALDVLRPLSDADFLAFMDRIASGEPLTTIAPQRAAA